MTLSLPAASPVAELPWVVTIGALSDLEDWEPIVFGPYERAHALALAQAVVADEELMAVVEPLLPLTSATEIRAEIETARKAEEAVGTPDEPDPEPVEHVEPGPEPSVAEVVAGFARLASRLPGNSRTR